MTLPQLIMCVCVYSMEGIRRAAGKGRSIRCNWSEWVGEYGHFVGLGGVELFVPAEEVFQSEQPVGQNDHIISRLKDYIDRESTSQGMRGASYRDLMIEVKIFKLLPIEAETSFTPRRLVQLFPPILTLIVSTVSGGRHIGLKDRLLGAIGTISIESTPLASIGPPADSE